MLEIRSFTFNPFQENTYLIINEQKLCWIVDPGMYDATETNSFFNYIAAHSLQPQSIINTHAHIDHIFGVQATMDKYKIPFGVNEKELPVLQSAVASAMMFGLDFSITPRPSFYIETDRSLELGEDKIDVRFTPGHSPGSISFYSEEGNWLLGGDVLFYGSIGRTDLPGGHHQTLLESIKSRLLPLPENTIVYSGHGPSTTIGHEKKHNPFLI